MQYYVYALARPTKGEWAVFYIGKGSKRRVFAHENEARSGCKCHKCNIIRKVWKEGSDIQRYILLTTESEQEAFEYEREMIALHGRDNLCNHTAGGEGGGVFGRIVSEETRRKTSMAQKGIPKGTTITEEGRRKLSDIHKGNAYRLGKNHSEATRLKMSEVRKARAEDPQWRARVGEATRKNWQNPKIKEKQRESLKQVAADPAWRAKISVASKRAWQSPEHREKQKAGMAAYFSHRREERQRQADATDPKQDQ